MIAISTMGVAGQTSGANIAAVRAQHLRRGINASIWFAQSPRNYSVERLRRFTTEDDITLMEKLGFDHVRLSIDAVPLTEAFGVGDGAPFLVELDRVVKAMVAHHLAVIVDVHPEDAYKKELLEGAASKERFVALWTKLAEHYTKTDPATVFFEVMNEPEQKDAARWEDVQGAAAAAIRTAAPQHTIIATGLHYSGLDDLLRAEPMKMSNVIYTFHDYEPFAFTHQGATWTMNEVKPLRGVPYPSSPEAVEGNLSQEPALEGKYFVEQYGQGRWDAGRIESMARFAEMWSEEHQVPVYCGEFGVLRAFADPKMRAQWVHDTRTALERHHIGWAMWDYQTDFGLVVKKDGGKAVPDPGMVQALGLK